MQTLQAIITGTIQGLSEFLPISSSAHICFSNELFGLITNTKVLNSINQEEIFFDIMVHLATLFAVIIYFFNDLKNIFKGFFNSIKEKNYEDENFKIFIYILISTVITGVIGLLLKDNVEKLIVNPQTICFFLIGTGLILLISEKFYNGTKKITLKSSIIMAIAQGLAVFPGFSRSGLTISSALLNGVDRINAARFSFLMSIPVILLAGLIYPILELDFNEISSFNFKAIFLGTLSSFVIGYLCIKYFMRLLGKISLRAFGYYCIIISIIMYLVFEFFRH